MAKKTTNKGNKGINLLKGITGSKLAKLATLVIILFAIPLTITMLKQQQNLQQEASVIDGTRVSHYTCGINGGKCLDKAKCLASGGYVKYKVGTDLCAGAWPKNYECCVPNDLKKPSLCSSEWPRGKCQYDNLGLPCKSGYKSGLCKQSSDRHYLCCVSRY